MAFGSFDGDARVHHLEGVVVAVTVGDPVTDGFDFPVDGSVMSGDERREIGIDCGLLGIIPEVVIAMPLRIAKIPADEFPGA